MLIRQLSKKLQFLLHIAKFEQELEQRATRVLRDTTFDFMKDGITRRLKLECSVELRIIVALDDEKTDRQRAIQTAN
jgi:hypothetical protein